MSHQVLRQRFVRGRNACEWFVSSTWRWRWVAMIIARVRGFLQWDDDCGGFLAVRAQPRVVEVTARVHTRQTARRFKRDKS